MATHNQIVLPILCSLLCAGAIGFSGSAFSASSNHTGNPMQQKNTGTDSDIGNADSDDKSGRTSQNSMTRAGANDPSSGASPQARQLGNDIQNYNKSGGSSNKPVPQSHVKGQRESPPATQLGNDIQNYNKSGGSSNKPVPQPDVKSQPESPQSKQLSNDITNYNRSGGSSNNPPSRSSTDDNKDPNN